MPSPAEPVIFMEPVIFITKQHGWHPACGVPIRTAHRHTLQPGTTPQMALREFTDNEGRHWTVWDVHPTAFRARDGRTSGGYNPPAWLAFHCKATHERRRLVPIPDEWGTCTDAELCALMQMAETLASR